MAIFGNFYIRQTGFAVLHAGGVLFGLAPFDFWPAGFLAIFALLCALHGQKHVTWRQIIIAGILFAGALVAVTFTWIVTTIHRYTGEAFALTVVLAIFYAILFQTKPLLFFICAKIFGLSEARTARHVLAIAALISLVDFFAPELFVWSWGNTISGQPYLRQWAAIFSVYGLSFLAALGGTILYRFFCTNREIPIAERLRLLYFEAGLCVGIVGVGAALYHTQPRGERMLHALVVQTNIGAAPEKKRGDAAFATEAINRLFNQSLEGAMLHSATNLIVWPEAAMPFHAAHEDAENAAVYSASFDGVLAYLSRALGVTVVYQDMAVGSGQLFSEIAVRPQEGSARYEKRRLVPWGEYLPLESIWPGFRKVFPDAGKFSAGKKNEELTVPLAELGVTMPPRDKLVADVQILSHPADIRKRYAARTNTGSVKMKPLLCYEALFPEDARTANADIIVNLASDAWFGDGIEGWQHAGAASLRAVENGIPMLRAAMSGVSYVVDHRGEFTVQPTRQARAENLYADIPLQRRATVFSRFGMALFFIFLAAVSLPYLVLRLRRRA